MDLQRLIPCSMPPIYDIMLYEAKFMMTGGVAKNIGMFGALEKALGKPIRRIAMDSQINGAPGAAIFALEALKSGVNN
jgi:activator of 2-hydroxyglutaryl-CoA dehydratase